MAGAIRTPPVTRAYEEGWERVFGHPRREAPPEAPRLHVVCARCLKVLRGADSVCGCTSRSNRIPA